MKQYVQIADSDNRKLEARYGEYIGYLHILEYLINNTENGESNLLIDKKFDEAVEKYVSYLQLQEQLAKSYCPEGNWTDYKFYFAQSVVEYTNDD